MWPPQPVMWPQLPCTARAVGRSRRSFAESSQRFAARFGARTRGVRTAGTDTLTTSGLHDRTDRKVIFLICENRVSNVRHADAAHGCVSWRRALASSNGSKLALELKIGIWKDLGLQIHTRHVLRFPIIKRKTSTFPKTTVVFLKALKKLYEMHNNSCTLPAFWYIY